jgi:putative PEP-CTERM system TPR-repeat lipoprotein
MFVPLFRAGAIAIAIGSATVLLPGCGERSTDAVSEAKARLARDDAAGAAIQLKTALQRDSESAEIRFLLGSALLRLGDPLAAIVELEKARDRGHPDNEVVPLLATARLGAGQARQVLQAFGALTLPDAKADSSLKATLAAAHAANGRTDLAAQSARAALERDPSNSIATLMLAKLAAGAGDIDGALASVESVIAADAQRPEAWSLKGDLLWLGKRDPSAAAAYRRSLELQPRQLPARVALLTMLLQQREVEAFKAAVAEFRKSWPGHPEVTYFEAQVAFVERDLKRARDLVQRLLKVAPDNPRVLQFAGAVELEAGGLLLAETHLTKALQLQPELEVARRMLAATYVRSDQTARALTVLAPLLEVPAPRAASLALAAEANLIAGNPQKAESLYLAAAKADPDDVQVRTALALTRIARGDTAGGFGALEEAAQADRSTHADLALISARLRREEFDAALKAVERLAAKEPGKPLPLLLRGRIEERRNRAPEARAAYEAALAADPRYFAATAALASLDMAAGRMPAARDRVTKALEADPKNGRGRLLLAEIAQRSGAAPAEITTLLGDAVRATPTEALPRQLLVEHLLEQRDVKGALVAAQEAVSSQPNSAKLLDSLGRVQLAGGEVQQAITSFRKAATVEPRSPLPHLRIADALVKSGDVPGAIASLRRAADLDPTLVQARQREVTLLIKQRQFDDALRVARAVQKQLPQDIVGLFMEADVHEAAERTDDAVRAYRAALEQRPSSTQAAIRLHQVLLLSRREADARTFAAGFLGKRPADAGFLYHLGHTALATGDYAQAEERFRRILQLRPQDSPAMNNLAWVLVKLNRPGAAALAQRAVDASPKEAAFMDTLALALDAEGQRAKAIEWQRKAVALQPSKNAFRLQLARLLAADGQKAEARKELEPLARLGSAFPGHREVQTLLTSL